MDTHKLKDEHHDFVLKNGTKLHSLKDLYGELSTMTDDTFNHHVSEIKNDFASWIEHSHEDKSLAYTLRHAKTRDEMRKAIFMAMFK
jgi:hypothetical protein